MSPAPIAALSLVAETKVVALAVPFHWTTHAVVKFLPFTVRVKAADPAAFEEGDSPVIEGVFA